LCIFGVDNAMICQAKTFSRIHKPYVSFA